MRPTGLQISEFTVVSIPQLPTSQPRRRDSRKGTRAAPKDSPFPHSVPAAKNSGKARNGLVPRATNQLVQPMGFIVCLLVKEHFYTLRQEGLFPQLFREGSALRQNIGRNREDFRSLRGKERFRVERKSN